MNVQEIANTIAKASKQYNHFGIRTSDKKYQTNHRVGNSHNWTMDGRTSQMLNGACATGFGYLWCDGEKEDVAEIEKALKINSAYSGAHQYLIAGHNCTDGDDKGEIVIENAVCIAVLR